jgi:hypothetical protein
MWNTISLLWKFCTENNFLCVCVRGWFALSCYVDKCFIIMCVCCTLKEAWLQCDTVISSLSNLFSLCWSLRSIHCIHTRLNIYEYVCLYVCVCVIPTPGFAVANLVYRTMYKLINITSEIYAFMETIDKTRWKLTSIKLICVLRNQ